jgi:D-arabinose 1-dehydrogenase-like Zn-dependent alcohol dehydrogenase
LPDIDAAQKKTVRDLTGRTQAQSTYRAVQAVSPAFAKKLGAHHDIDSSATAPAEALQALGGAAVVVATVSAGEGMAARLRMVLTMNA